MVNVVRMIDALGLRRVSAGSLAYADHWTQCLDIVQADAIAARRVQSECELLERCTKARDGGDVEHEGYPIALEGATGDARTYVIHIPSLKHLVRVQTKEKLTLLRKITLRLHLFLDESSMRRKVRVTVQPKVVSVS